LGLSATLWLLIAAFCGIIEFAGFFATNNIIYPQSTWWSDSAFIIVFAFVGGFALINALWLHAGTLLRRNG
jgi:hypothetical protein